MREKGSKSRFNFKILISQRKERKFRKVGNTLCTNERGLSLSSTCLACVPELWLRTINCSEGQRGKVANKPEALPKDNELRPTGCWSSQSSGVTGCGPVIHVSKHPKMFVLYDLWTKSTQRFECPCCSLLYPSLDCH